MERGERSYTMTLPLGTPVGITVHTGLIPQANALYEENRATGYTFPDALAMLALTTVNGEQVREVSTATLLDPVEYTTLRYVVENLMKPTQQQMDATVATLKLVEKPTVLEPVDTYMADSGRPEDFGIDPNSGTPNRVTEDELRAVKAVPMASQYVPNTQPAHTNQQQYYNPSNGPTTT
jgi:hypothetical protein